MNDGSKSKREACRVLGKAAVWILFLGLLVGCRAQADSAVPETASQESAQLLLTSTPSPPWVVIAEMEFGQPSISTKFRDESFGITTDLGGGIHLTQDGGQTWEYIQDAAFSRVALEIVDENLIFHIGWYGPVIRSMDGGYTWEYLESLPHSGHTEYTSFTDQNNGWAATTELDEFWITTDGAQTWATHPLPDGMGTIAALHLRTPLDAYFLDLAGNLFITTDGGGTWHRHSIELEDGWLIPELNHSAAMRFPDADHGLIALDIIGEGTGKTYALRTTDGGETWVEEELPVGMGMFHLSRDGRYLTYVDLFDHGKFTLLRSTSEVTDE